MRPSERNLRASILLIFTAPFVAEYLLGDIGIKAIATIIVMAPMYGGGALLIREIARRLKLGWPRMLLLAAAYALVEEGFTTMSLFNRDYLKMHMHLLDHAWIAPLGISAWWTLFMLNLHTFWSMAVSIALVEGLFPAQRETPWLGKLGDSVVAALFAIGCVLSTAITLHMDPYVASHTQLDVTAALIVLLVALAILLPFFPQREFTGSVPPPWLTGAVALALGLGVLLIPPVWNWGAFAAMCALDAVFLVGLSLLHRRSGWTAVHTLSIAAGGAFAYGIHAFWQTPVLGARPVVLLRGGQAAFLLLAALMVLAGARRTARWLRTRGFAVANQRPGDARPDLSELPG